LQDLYERSIEEDKGEVVFTSRPVRTVRAGPRSSVCHFGFSYRPACPNNQFDLVSLYITKGRVIGEEVLAYCREVPTFTESV
jgi:hypothetical protein